MQTKEEKNIEKELTKNMPNDQIQKRNSILPEDFWEKAKINWDKILKQPKE